ncbi:peptide chain release factor 3 [Sulfitobacter sp. SK012]|uniref:peptide chain release factor 3 n=1 Tax=Sulfitobacter sp. SK012 TaxID=1389005 RepID=UPI000E0A1625|nr:peptide chain release factor 3 [Sulfitobacter sp. SK012]AXI48834.1 peptide chain release factor 3 [Sulfitobacter sp. SK012]
MSDTPQNRPALPAEIARRRTFAIISHPDAGKTTLTEKFLLFGGAIQMAGQVRAKGEARRTRSDFMAMEKDRGISVSASAMSFDFALKDTNFRFNLVDTPGHSDFSEDTYRTLTAVDAAVMVIDGAKGVESQTQKLFEVCRMRDLPILTFCNKMDRESRDVFEIIDEIQQNLAIDVTPASWPIGVGRDFIGCYDILRDRLELMDRADRNKVSESIEINSLDDPQLTEHVPAALLEKLREDLEMVRELMPPLDIAAMHEGSLTPIWFGSAINSFGVKELMRGIATFGPEPQIQSAEPRQILPEETKVSGFVFKVQANMDPKHRDRVAFVRLASGHFLRGMKLTHVRSKKQMAITAPVMFLASDRELAEEAWAGDIIGIPNHGQLRIGDTLTEGEALRVTGIPSFAPELLQGVRAGDPLKSKHLEKALMQFAEEGAAKVFKPSIGSGFIVGVVGQLQFEVLASRIELEYGLPVRFEQSQFTSARWVNGTKQDVDKFTDTNQQHIAYDHDGDIVYLTRLQWDIDRVDRDYPDIRLTATKEMMV